MANVEFQDWGVCNYQQAWEQQEEIFSNTVALKTANRDQEIKTETKNHLIFCEHPHVYTLGKSGKIDNLLLDDSELKEKQAEFYRINRGGDITYHGPGQLVGYPIFDLDHFFTDIHKYLRYLEEAIILTLKDYQIESGRIAGLTGVWVEPENQEKARKICAMGIRCSRWVTMHGFAFNVNTDLSYFKHIIPCGIDDKAVTSLAAELGKQVDMNELKSILKNHLAQLFNFNYINSYDKPILRN